MRGIQEHTDKGALVGQGQFHIGYVVSHFSFPSEWGYKLSSHFKKNARFDMFTENEATLIIVVCSFVLNERVE